MAINFEEEEKLQWKFIIPIVLLVIALAASVWACMGQKSTIKDLQQQLSMTSHELTKYKNLYVEKTSNVRSSENFSEDITRRLQECQESNLALEDQLDALLLGEQSNVANTQ